MAREELLRSDSFDVFPAGLRVLVVDDDALCLKVVEHMLRRCNYIGAGLCLQLIQARAAGYLCSHGPLLSVDALIIKSSL